MGSGKAGNEYDHGKVMEHEKLAKSHRILLSVMEFYQFCPLNRTKFVCFYATTTEKLSIRVESLHFLMFFAKCAVGKIETRDGHGKLKIVHGRVVKKYSLRQP